MQHPCFVFEQLQVELDSQQWRPSIPMMNREPPSWANRCEDGLYADAEVVDRSTLLLQRMAGKERDLHHLLIIIQIDIQISNQLKREQEFKHTCMPPIRIGSRSGSLMERIWTSLMVRMVRIGSSNGSSTG